MADTGSDIQIPPDCPTEFLLEKHVEYLRNYGKGDSQYEYEISEYLRMSGLYWSLTAVHILGHGDVLDRDGILKFVDDCLHEDTGGFGAAVGHDPHVLYTLSAIQVLVIYNALEDRHIECAVKYIKTLQLPDGSFQGDQWGEVDSRFSFCAVACLALCGRLHEIDLKKCASFLQQCMNFDGGFGVVPSSESHAGQIFCCVSALAIMEQLHRIDVDSLGFWLAERQLPSGGFNGRPEKLPDVCYSWWVLSALKTIDRIHWIDADKLASFILAAQDDENGGIADRPGDMVDPFHTLFGTTGLSLLQHDKRLVEIDPIFCMPADIVRRQLGKN